MKRLALLPLAALALAACQDATKPELTTPGVSPAYQGAPVSTFTVTNTNDDGAGSLRQAILNANASTGFDAIEFNIPSTGPHTIQPLSALPRITEPVVIDGYTQSGASPNTNGPDLGTNAVLMIELDGTNAGDNVNGLIIEAGGNTVRGLVINRFPGFGDGIIILFNGGNSIQGNFIGTDVSGTTELPNDIGVLISANSKGNIIGTDGDGVDDGAERNLISGNVRDGIRLQRGPVGAATDLNVIAGNLIGTDRTGTLAVGNQRTDSCPVRR